MVAVRLGRVVVLVHHYDEALAFYTERFGCEVVLDRPGPDGLRFVHVRFPGDAAAIWLLRPGGETGADRVGAQTGGEPVAVLYTDDLESWLPGGGPGRSTSGSTPMSPRGRRSATCWTCTATSSSPSSWPS